MSFSTLIFDWSGVISDDRRPVYEANMKLLKRYGKPGMNFEDWLPKTTLSVREFLANNGVTADPDQLFKEYTQLFNKVRKEGINPVMYGDATEVLQALSDKRKKLIVVSSHPENNLRDEAKEYDIEKYFHLFLGNAKNKTEAIFKACKDIKTKISNKSVAYIGDTVFDIQSARDAKVYSIGITTGYHARERLRAAEPDKIIDNLAELLYL